MIFDLMLNMIDSLATRITALEAHKEACDDRYIQDNTKEDDVSYCLGMDLLEAKETIARLEEIINEKDEQIAKLLEAPRRITYGTWSL